MKAKLLKQLLNTERTVQETEKKICISSYWVYDLIAVNKETLKLTYAMDAFNEGRDALKSEELESIWDKLESMIKDGSIHDIIDGNDSIEGMKEFYYYDDITKSVIKSYADEPLEYPNVDYTGKIIYDNNHFETEEDAKKYAVSRLISSLSYEEDYLSDMISREEQTCKRIKEIHQALEKLTK